MNDLLSDPKMLGILAVGAVVVLVVATRSGGGGTLIQAPGIDAQGYAAMQQASAAQAALNLDAQKSGGELLTSYLAMKEASRVKVTELQVNAQSERYRLETAAALTRDGFTLQRDLATTEAGVKKEEIAAGERNNQRDNSTAQTNGILGFFGNIIGTIAGFFL